MLDSKMMKYVTTAILVLAFATAGVASGPAPWWGGLEPGPYGIGFKTLEMYDYSRTFGAAADYFGTPSDRAAARPIQLCLWYPAAADDNGLPMVYGEYAFPSPDDDEFFDLVSSLQQRELGIAFFFSGNSSAVVHDIMNVPMAAVRDAARAEGSFPLIIFHPGIEGSFSQNVTLCEYLAGHGFIVATSQPIGEAAVNGSDNLIDLEAAVRDREFVATYMRSFPGVDIARMGVLGMASGGLAALIHQMRNTDVKAVVSLHGSFIMADKVDPIIDNPFFNTGRASVPILHMYSNDQQPLDQRLVDSLKHADRYTIRLTQGQPTDFSIYSKMSLAGGDTTRPVQTVSDCFETTCRYVHQFFEAQLNQNDKAIAFLSASAVENGLNPDLIETGFMAGARPAPTSDQFAQIIQDYGVAKALELCRQYRLDNPDHPLLPEATINALGYRQLQGGNNDGAVSLLKMGTIAYPASCNSWDSFGEACQAAGDYVQALKSFHRANELIDNDSTTNPRLKEQIRAANPGHIEQLEALIARQGQPSGK